MITKLKSEEVIKYVAEGFSSKKCNQENFFTRHFCNLLKNEDVNKMKYSVHLNSMVIYSMYLSCRWKSLLILF